MRRLEESDGSVEEFYISFLCDEALIAELVRRGYSRPKLKSGPDPPSCPPSCRESAEVGVGDKCVISGGKYKGEECRVVDFTKKMVEVVLLRSQVRKRIMASSLSQSLLKRPSSKLSLKEGCLQDQFGTTLDVGISVKVLFTRSTLGQCDPATFRGVVREMCKNGVIVVENTYGRTFRVCAADIQVLGTGVAELGRCYVCDEVGEVGLSCTHCEDSGLTYE